MIYNDWFDSEREADREADEPIQYGHFMAFVIGITVLAVTILWIAR